MKTKTEKDGLHPSTNYLVVEDANEPSTWHLRVRNTFGQPDFKLMGEAWAALHEGFRGQKYEGPQKQEALRKLIELYHQENLRLPGVKNRASGERVILCNRSDDDEDWIHIVPKGELPNGDAKLVQVLDDKSMASILAAIERERGAQGDNWPGLYAGKEHFIYDPKQDSAALAWFKDFQLRDNGIWASRDGLTPDGRKAIKNRKYKYTSFVADRNDLEHLGGARYRVKAIETVGFTNFANGRDLLTPIMNRRPGTNQDGQPMDNTPAILRRAQASAADQEAAILSGDPLTPEQREQREKAYKMWWEKIASAAGVARKTSGRVMNLQWLWDHCKAEYPHIYEAAFGRDTDVTAAQSAADQAAARANVAMVINRLEKDWGMGWSAAWNFVRTELPQLFNRQFNAGEFARTGQSVNQDNFAGVAKRAQKVFLDLVHQEERLLGIKGMEAIRRVGNREPELRALANYETTPAEAFRRAPALEGKLLNRTLPMSDSEVQEKAKRLFDKLVKDTMEHGNGYNTKCDLQGAYRHVMNREKVLRALRNKEITAAQAFAREPDLRERMEKIYVVA